MLTPYTRSKFIRKIITSPTGERFQVLFLVTLVNGEVNAQVISAERIHSSDLLLTGTSGASQNHPFYLPVGQSLKDLPEVVRHFYSHIVSPYIELYFFTSQPTRAPSFR
ncbi:MAG: hypothetical protein NTZ38_01495 [Candidatus Taylorbacteria bacterium]|nr:hypothetical protein [Candidatus Taylorbacteria bacterium]